METVEEIEALYDKLKITHQTKEIFVKRWFDEEFDAKQAIKFYESMYISYKKMLEDMFKNRASFPPGDEFTEWYKNELREGKNSAEAHLKDAHEIYKYFKEGLNHPALYRDSEYTHRRKNKDIHSK